MTRWLGLDIGGANIKAADGCGFAASYRFPLWKAPQQLAQQLRTVLAEAPRADRLAVTMTGELADCFVDRRSGVTAILEAVEQAAQGRHTRVYTIGGKLVTPGVVRDQPLRAASANWHALAQFAGRFHPQGHALLLDVGSTTCDLVPLQDGRPAGRGQTDLERILAGELVYTGIERSPVCAVLARVPYRGQSCPLAQELFATMLDVYLLLGQIPEDTSLVTTTADGRPATRSAARTRLGRMLCAELDQFHHRDAAVVAEALAAAQAERVAQAARQVFQAQAAVPDCMIVAGHGDFLAKRVFKSLAFPGTVIPLTRKLGPGPARCAPAHALAVLAAEGSG